MKIAEFSVKNSLFVNLLSLFFIISGIFALFNLNREAFPTISFDKVGVTTVYPGATSDEVERLVTTPIEKELKDVDGVEEIISSSREGISTIMITIDPDYKDKDQVVNDIYRSVDRVDDLPADIEDDPLVIEIKSDEIPVIMVSISGLQERELQYWAEVLEDRFLEIDGAGSVHKAGFRDKEIWIEVDPKKLDEYYVSIDEITTALRQRNINVPAGEMKLPGGEIIVRTIGEFKTAEEVTDVIIRANDVGNWLRVKDVATVHDAFEDEQISFSVLGDRSIGLTVTKKSSGDAITIVREIKKIVESIKNEAPKGLTVTYANDLSYYIKRRLNVLKNNGIVGIFLVVSVLLLFLSRSVAIMTAWGIPVAFMITFTVMSALGISINLLTMFGLIIVLGMIVDDGIIISENVYRYIEGGMLPREAAIKGTEEVVKPVVATVITTIVAFSPLMIITGIIGRFVKYIPMIVVIALSASLLEALVILPSHMADFVKKPKMINGKVQSKKDSPWFKALLSHYTNALNYVLDRRYRVVGCVAALFVVLVAIAVFVMPFRLFSSKGVEEFYIKVEAPMGTPIEKTNEMIRPIEEIVASISDKELDVYGTQIGVTGDTYMTDPYEQRGSHLGQVMVYLTPISKRKRSAQQIADEVRDKINQIETGFTNIAVEIQGGGPPVGKPVAIRIRGENYETLIEVAEKIINFAENIPGLKDIKHDYRIGKGEFRVVVDREEAAQSGLNINQIASTIRSAIKGGVATTIKPTKAEEEINVLVRFPEEYRNDKEDFENLSIRNSYGNLVPLNRIATIEEGKSLDVIRHLDGKRVVSVTANVEEKKITPAKANAMIKQHFKNIENEYPGIVVKYSGEQEDNEEMLRSLLKAFILAFFMIFLILASVFRSLIQPVIIMLAIPMGIIGVILAFLLHGMEFSFLAIMGIIGLNGVVVNDSIVLVDFINNLRRSGEDRRDSLIKAGQMRLRPVILTSITTVFGLFPTAYGIGGFDPFLKPMAIAISWGLLFATFMTLLVIPAIYAIVDDIHIQFLHKGTVSPNNNHK